MNQALSNPFNSFFFKNDKFLRSFSEYKPDTPLMITNENEKIEVIGAIRDAHKFLIKCKIHNKQSLKPRATTLKFSSIHCSYIKMVERFGLSKDAKCLYKGLDVYDAHFSGQANLTTLRWHSMVDNNQITAHSDIGKDLIFNGELLAVSIVMQSANIKVYRSDRKDKEYVVTYQVKHSNQTKILDCFKITDNINLMLGFNEKDELINYLETLENYWDCKHVY